MNRYDPETYILAIILLIGLAIVVWAIDRGIKRLFNDLAKSYQKYYPKHQGGYHDEIDHLHDQDIQKFAEKENDQKNHKTRNIETM